ncbi:hypothetical protein QR98_0007630 [Sarcoptes scabiei]|uniref:Uncharacterized protein n=1 Tax=Sarcoptes scabiei TaxID=52283 RepID=A0A131ZUS8_SARSC|nr:hypothetical protein QR98_0007630 [Sarcoptes scabiei]
MSKEQPIKGAAWVAVTAIIVGLIFVIAGAIITGIAYTEITPPNYDDYYNRYIGSSVPRLIGPFVLVFGAVIIFGSIVIMVLMNMRYQYKEVPNHG